MAAKMKYYTTEFPVHAGRAAKALLDQAAHINGAQMYVIAPTKVAAAEMLTQSDDVVGYYLPRELRLAYGSVIDCLAGAALCDEPVIYLLPQNYSGAPGAVVKSVPGGDPVVIGRTSRAEIAYQLIFIPV